MTYLTFNSKEVYQTLVCAALVWTSLFSEATQPYDTASDLASVATTTFISNFSNSWTTSDLTSNSEINPYLLIDETNEL